MDIDGLSFEAFDLDQCAPGSKALPPVKYIKQTFLQSPIFINIIPQFKVRINKPFRGLSGTSFNDESYQHLLPVEQDSQLDAFSDDDSDDELLLQLKDDTNVNSEPDTGPAQLRSVKVIVKPRSLLVNNVEFPSTSEIRSSCLVRGIQDENDRASTSDSEDGKDIETQAQGEDSLLISLKTGFLLLIRIYYVPRHYRDSDYKYQAQSHIPHQGNSIFKPFIVQWWDTNPSRTLPTLHTSGYHLLSHRSGLSVISTSASGLFRIYNTQLTSNGIMFKKHVNVECDGLILHSCFAEPFNNAKVDHHNFFLAFVFTEFRRFTLNLFSWSNLEGLSESFTRSTLPLDNNFEVPVFIVALSNNEGFLFVSEGEFIIITIHDIMSAEYDFKRFTPPWKGVSFPTSWYRPQRNLKGDHAMDEPEVLIATDNGTVFAVRMERNNLIITPVAKVNDSISVFSLERIANGYNLIYGSDTGSNKDLLLPRLIDLELESDNSRLSYTKGKINKDYKKWTPLLDVSIIDASTSRLANNQSKQELYAISGVGKKTKLSHFKYGYSAQRKSNSYNKLRKAERIQFTTFETKIYLFCSFTFETILLEYQPNSLEAFIEIDSHDGFIHNGKTFYVTTLEMENQDELIFQVSSRGIILTDLTNFQINHILSDRNIIGCDVCGSLMVIMTESESEGVIVELFELNFRLSQESTFQEFVISRQQIPVINPTIVKFIGSKESSGESSKEIPSFLLVATYQGTISFFQLQDDVELIREIDLHAFNPYKEADELHSELLVTGSLECSQNQLYVGTLDGYFVNLQLPLSNDEDIICSKFLRLSEVPVKLELFKDDPKFLFIHSKSLWLLNLYDSKYPYKVYFEETYERSISSISRLPVSHMLEDSTSNIQFAFVRDDGLMLGNVHTFKEANVKQLTAENAKKLFYLPFISTFIILCKSKYQDKRLKFVDRKLFKEIPYEEGSLRSADFGGQIFETYEYPLTACIWSVQRNNRISKKLLVGTSVIDSSAGNLRDKYGIPIEPPSKGFFRVLDVAKVRGNNSIKVTELTTFEHHEPITNIAQVNSDIIFTSGKSIHCTSYNVDEKRLKQVQTIANLPSEITSLSTNDNNNKLIVTTKLDSIYQFDYESPVDASSPIMNYVNSDPLPNSIVNQAQLNSKIVTGDKLHSSISIIDGEQLGKSIRISYRMSNIPRVYASNFQSCWVQDETSDLIDKGMIESASRNTAEMVLCIGVNGEVTCIREVVEDSEELSRLGDQMNESTMFKASVEELIEKLERPFVNKVSGTGLLSINKPSFDFRDNKGVVIDYDLEEITGICEVRVAI